MKPKTKFFTAWHIGTSLFMILALSWLTVSTPYVYSAQQQMKVLSQQPADTGDETNPFSNTTEEKSESGVNTLSEYLHDTHHLEHHPVILKKFYKCHPSDLYVAFHPELVSPPPKA